MIAAAGVPEPARARPEESDRLRAHLVALLRAEPLAPAPPRSRHLRRHVLLHDVVSAILST